MFLLGTKGVDVTEFNVETGAFIRAFVPELQVPYFLSTSQHWTPNDIDAASSLRIRSDDVTWRVCFSLRRQLFKVMTTRLLSPLLIVLLLFQAVVVVWYRFCVCCDDANCNPCAAFSFDPTECMTPSQLAAAAMRHPLTLEQYSLILEVVWGCDLTNHSGRVCWAWCARSDDDDGVQRRLGCAGEYQPGDDGCGDAKGYYQQPRQHNHRR
jgi:hypothetical protein